jgi:hypothetical protein
VKYWKLKTNLLEELVWLNLSQDVVIVEEDCGDKIGEVFTVEQSKEMGEKLSARVWGRYILSDLVADGKVLVKAGG